MLVQTGKATHTCRICKQQYTGRCGCAGAVARRRRNAKNRRMRNRQITRAAQAQRMRALSASIGGVAVNPSASPTADAPYQMKQTGGESDA